MEARGSELEGCLACADAHDVIRGCALAPRAPLTPHGSGAPPPRLGACVRHLSLPLHPAANPPLSACQKKARERNGIHRSHHRRPRTRRARTAQRGAARPRASRCAARLRRCGHWQCWRAADGARWRHDGPGSGGSGRAGRRRSGSGSGPARARHGKGGAAQRAAAGRGRFVQGPGSRCVFPATSPAPVSFGRERVAKAAAVRGRVCHCKRRQRLATV
jgi:hypothetical protein